MWLGNIAIQKAGLMKINGGEDGAAKYKTSA
jgi:hypothetical protein